jgi:hypothetical protein
MDNDCCERIPKIFIKAGEEASITESINSHHLNELENTEIKACHLSRQSVAGDIDLWGSGPHQRISLIKKEKTE